MDLLRDINSHLLTRTLEIQEARRDGKRLIGYSAGEYVPEELIYAAGCLPLCLIRGGDPEPVGVSHAYVPQFQCSFSKAQLGYKILDEDPHYRMLDYLVIAVTCQHIRRMGDLLTFYTPIQEFRFGIPRNFKNPESYVYYSKGIKDLKLFLEDITGKMIQEDRMREYVSLFNRMRTLLREIGELRKNVYPPISGKEFIRLHHATFYSDPHYLVHQLPQILNELKKSMAENCSMDHLRKPRLMLMGPNLAFGDYKIIEIIDQCGGTIVVEEFCEGMRYYLGKVDEDSKDLMVALSQFYYLNKLPCGYMIPVMELRYDFILKLIKEYNVDGVIWYQMKYCETYNLECFYMMNRIKSIGIPFLKLESEYNIAEREQFKTLIETFCNMLMKR
jgi:benzoyl-CoA reductase/2-hydroxyglutaryl-CoA dehydratase subunit BcrC/BadD/HgdB